MFSVSARSRQRVKSAFTLIELLVVIAIIAILAAILFPVFAQAREQARAITCVSNMKQIALGWIMYAQDYDEANPMTAVCESCAADGGQMRWLEVIEPYIKSGGESDVTKNKVSVFVCPDWQVPAPDKDEAGNARDWGNAVSLRPLG